MNTNQIVLIPLPILRQNIPFSHCFRHCLELKYKLRELTNRFQVCRDINPGMEVLVWYSDKYLQFMGIPVTLNTSGEDKKGEEDIDQPDSKLNGLCKYIYVILYSPRTSTGRQ